MKPKRARVPATAALLMVAAVLGGVLWFGLVHAEWSSSRSSSGLVNAGPPAEPVITVYIDIKPGSDPNSTNLGSHGVIPVAILTTADFDAASVDPSSVLFEGASSVHHALEAVDGDGDADLIMHFRTRHTEIAEDATEACLTGETTDGRSIQGCDAIRIVPPELDADGDGFGDAVEATLGTDQSAACPRNSQHDARPQDFDHDRDSDILDVLTFKPRFGSPGSGKSYSARHDLRGQDGIINILDVLAVKPYFNESCTP